MSGSLQTGLTWDDLLAFGEDGVRRELIDGAMYVSPAARYRHENTVEPDVVALAPRDLHRIQGLKVEGPPTLVIEISSPSNRGYGLLEKRALYERFGVPEYWLILDVDDVFGPAKAG